MELHMSPQRPYLLRALFDWLLDNQCTPHVVVDATQPFVEVPQEHVKDGQIVLNIHPDALTGFTMDLEHIGFEARFGGVARRIYLPMHAIIAIYARENGAGTIFEVEPGLEPDTQPDNPSTSPQAVKDTETDGEGGNEPNDTPPRKRPSLKVVK